MQNNPSLESASRELLARVDALCSNRSPMGMSHEWRAIYFARDAVRIALNNATYQAILARATSGVEFARYRDPHGNVSYLEVERG